MVNRTDILNFQGAMYRNSQLDHQHIVLFSTCYIDPSQCQMVVSLYTVDESACGSLLLLQFRTTIKYLFVDIEKLYVHG